MTDLKGKTVLVVDDEHDVRQYLTMMLEDAGLTVVTAQDGNEALDIIKKQPPDAISLDLVMPGKSGAKLYRELSKHAEWSKIPVLIVTGHARDELGKADLKELTISGPGIYLEKPVKPHNYIAAIKKLLGVEINGSEAEAAREVELQNELKNLIDEADAKTLETIRQLIKKRSK
ncbi:MAG: response regulator [Candidatus Zixiibacteriota bacterium]